LLDVIAGLCSILLSKAC